MTIFALASAPGRAAIAVIRVSGPATSMTVTALTGHDLPRPREATLHHLKDPITGDHLDDGLVLWFPGPASYTGEDSAEFHLHGGRAVIMGILDVLARLPGLRPAEPGEFTRRAVINGKLDLTRAEAVADLVDAATDRQRRQALSQLEGGLDDLYQGWSERISNLLARTEAEIDFPDEDLPADVVAGIGRDIATLRAEMQRHLDDAHRAERLRRGLSVAIVGPPNVGKSSLLNRLAQRDAAIVSEEAGTTRDVVEVVMDIAGFEVILADTAGIRESPGVIENEGIRRARDLAASADIKLVVIDTVHAREQAPEVAELVDASCIIVANKCDLGDLPQDWSLSGESCLQISCITGTGMDELMAAIENRLSQQWADVASGPGASRERHRSGVEAAQAALDRACGASLPELLSEDLRMASRALGRITGRADVEDLLDVVFRDFCIGK